MQPDYFDNRSRIVNSEQLLFNWGLGRDLVVRKAEERWGAGVVEQVSLDLKAGFPSAKGFSTTNLWYMKKWYLFYSSEGGDEILHQLGGELEDMSVKRLGQVGRVAWGEARYLPTANLDDGSTVHEIMVLDVRLKGDAQPTRAIEAVASSNPHKLVFHTEPAGTTYVLRKGLKSSDALESLVL